MNVFANHLSVVELSALSSAIGSNWDNYGGSSLSDDGRFAFEDCYLKTSNGTYTISSSLIQCPLPTGEEEITQLSIRVGTTDSRKASKLGLQFFQHKGECIESISIVQATVHMFESGVQTFSLTFDHGIIFHLTNGVVSISRDSWFLEDIRVEMFSSFDHLTIDDRAIDWDSDLTTEYRVSHNVVDLKDLLR